MSKLPYESGTGTLSDPYLICTAGQFSRIGDNPSAYFKLKANVDLSAATTVPTLTGDLDGAGYTMRNFSADSCLITSATGASIHDLVIEDFSVVNLGVSGLSASFLICDGASVNLSDITLRDSTATLNNQFFGGLIGQFGGGAAVLTNITIEDISVASSSAVYALAGGTCSSCTVSNYQIRDTELEGNPVTGGLSQFQSGDIQDVQISDVSINSFSVGASLMNVATEALIKNVSATGLTITALSSAGGVAVSSTQSTEFVGVTVDGSISGGASGGNLGGIVAETVDTDFLECTNNASLTDGGIATSLGGIAGAGFTSGNNYGSRFLSVVNSGTITSTGNATVAGIIGITTPKTLITRSVNSGALSTDTGAIGGLMGDGTGDLAIVNSYNSGQVTATNGSPAGLIGSQSGNTNVAHSFSTGVLAGATPNGLIGAGGSASVYASYFDSTRAGTTTSVGGGRAITTAEMQDAAIFFNYEDQQTWTVSGMAPPTLRPRDLVTNHTRCNRGMAPLGSGTLGDPYLFCSPSQLSAVALTTGVYAKLNRDIYFFGDTPISAMNGIFEGDHFLISGSAGSAYINQMSDPTAVLKNIHFAGLSNIDAVISNFDAGVIENIFVSNLFTRGLPTGFINRMIGGQISDVREFIEGNTVMAGFGGLISEVASGAPITLQNISINLDLNDGASNAHNVGGMIGSFARFTATDDVSMENINTSGRITLGGGSSKMGAWIGNVTAQIGARIEKSTSTVDVTGGTEIGGAIGVGGAFEIYDSNIAGDVRALDSGGAAGGIAGVNLIKLERVFFTGAVQATGGGGAIADAIIANSVVSGGDCFFDSDLSIAGTTTQCLGRTTAQMRVQGTFTNFDFTNIWNPPAAGYPTLR